MSEHGYFWNSRGGDRRYNAESMSDWLKRFFTSGVFNGDLQVTSTSGMEISVAPGYVCIEGKVMNFDNAQTFTLDIAYSTLSRVDTVVVERNDGDRTFYLKVVKGTTSGEPEAPIRSDGIYQLVLAQISVEAGTTAITQADITDTRMDSELCGWVTGTVEELPWEQITAQWEAYYTEFKTEQMDDFTTWTAAQKALWLAWVAEAHQWMADEQEDFLEWYDYIKDILDESTAGHLQNEIEALTESTEEQFSNLQTDLSTNYEKKHYWVNYIIQLDNWDTDTNIYSFENDYPSDTYDILNILPASNASETQRQQWAQIDCGGYYETNFIVANGSLPEIDIPVVMDIRSRS